MNTTQRKRLWTVLLLLAGITITAFLVLFALSQNINFFYTPATLLEANEINNKIVRLGGMVLKNSVKRQEGINVNFVITDFKQEVTVSYSGILPDLFREGQGIVALGKLDEKGVFQAHEVLAKHDENYMPPEVASSLKQNGK